MRSSFALCLCVSVVLPAQSLSHRGFLETRAVLYPQAAPGDSGRAVGDVLLRYQPSYKVSAALQLFGAFDARADTHRQVERRWDLSWQDRARQRPAFSVRRLSALWRRGRFSAEVGKQFIRWGKADILNPTDRFAPRDYLAVVDNEFLGVAAARLAYQAGSDTFEAVYTPRFTPSRIPLINQRWAPLPEDAPAGLEIRQAAPRFPGGPQFGVRWNHLGRGFEYSLSFYQGFNHLPLFDARLVSAAPLRVELHRFYPQMRMYGADAAVPLRWFTLKGEAAYFTGRTRQADEYVLYVVQVERQAGEWFFIGGYAGEAVTQRRGSLDFLPDRGLARAFLARAGYTIDANRSVAFQAAVRENGKGVWAELEYSQMVGQHWRATARFALIRGSAADFLGQFRRNSHATLALRYSF